MRQRWRTILKVVIMVGAYGYLAYLLITFDRYDQLFDSFSNLTTLRWLLLLAAFLLMPVNWGVEAWKWKSVTSRLQTLSYGSAYKAVLMGLASGFFTPNRICDPVGRVMPLDEGNKGKGVMLSFVCTAAQSFACVFFLLISLSIGSIPQFLSLPSIICVAIALLAYITLPLWGKYVKIPKVPVIDNAFRAMDEVSYPMLLTVSAQSALRFAIYSTQYYFMLLFMGVELTPFMALVLIPVNYFLISVTPSVSFSEVGIRGSYASLLIGGFTGEPVAAALAAVIVWVINYIVPLIAGTLFVARCK